MPEDPDTRPRLSGHLRLGPRAWQFDGEVSERTAGMLIFAAAFWVVMTVIAALALIAVLIWLIVQAV